jgi:prepilin peptidase CpaA
VTSDATPLLVGGLAVACLTDLRDRRIPNALVIALGVAGVGGAALGWSPGLSGSDAVAGLGLGFLLWLPFHLAGMLGAGDVKLFAAAAAWLGPRGALDAALLTALVGGVLAALVLWREAGFRGGILRLAAAWHAPQLLRLEVRPAATRLPYALAIATGVLGAHWRSVGVA